MTPKRLKLPVRYFSIIPVAKDFVSNVQGQEKMDDRENESILGEIRKTQRMISSSVISAGVVNSLSPYLFVLIETETGGAYWQYLDLAGSLSMLAFTDEKSYVLADKIIYENGSYMYQVKKICIERKQK